MFDNDKSIRIDNAPVTSFKNQQRCTFGSSVYTSAVMDRTTSYYHDTLFGFEVVDRDDNVVFKGGDILLSSLDGGKDDVWSQYSHSMIVPGSSNFPFTVRIRNKGQK
eukprot:Awhi_evm1s13390